MEKKFKEDFEIHKRKIELATSLVHNNSLEMLEIAQTLINKHVVQIQLERTAELNQE